MGMPVLSRVGGPSCGLGSASSGVGSISWGLGVRWDFAETSWACMWMSVTLSTVEPSLARKEEEARRDAQVALKGIGEAGTVASCASTPGTRRRTSKSLPASKFAPRATWKSARTIFRIRATIAFFLRCGA